MAQGKNSEEPALNTVSAAQLAAILSDPPFTDRWLRILADKGYLAKSGRAEYELAASVQGYIRFVRDDARRACRPTATPRRPGDEPRTPAIRVRYTSQQMTSQDHDDDREQTATTTTRCPMAPKPPTAAGLQAEALGGAAGAPATAQRSSAPWPSEPGHFADGFDD